jgi:hypothetical protein
MNNASMTVFLSPVLVALILKLFILQVNNAGVSGSTIDMEGRKDLKLEIDEVSLSI